MRDHDETLKWVRENLSRSKYWKVEEQSFEYGVPKTFLFCLEVVEPRDEFYSIVCHLIYLFKPHLRNNIAFQVESENYQHKQTWTPISESHYRLMVNLYGKG